MRKALERYRKTKETLEAISELNQYFVTAGPGRVEGA